MYVYIYILYIYIHTYIHIYVYIYMKIRPLVYDSQVMPGHMCNINMQVTVPCSCFTPVGGAGTVVMVHVETMLPLCTG